MKIKIYFKSLLGYTAMTMFFLFLNYFVDANLSRTLFYVLVSLLIISITGLIISVFAIKVRVISPSLKIKKREHFEYEVRISSKIIIPLCFVEIKMKKQEYLKNTGKDCYVSMVDSTRPLDVIFKYKGTVYGTDELEIEYLALRDFMGIVRVDKKVDECKSVVHTLPVYNEMSYSKNILALSNHTADFDDSDENTGIVNSTVGFPGYEHREYVNGDSMKRINYKLSAKRGKLLVRLDEPTSTMRQGIILDNLSSGNRKVDEIAIEGLMAYAGFLFNNSIFCEVHFNTPDGQKCISISSENDFAELIDDIGNVVFYPVKSVKTSISLENTKKISSCMIFTANKNIDHVLDKKPLLPMYITSANTECNGGNVLIINKNLEITAGGSL